MTGVNGRTDPVPAHSAHKSIRWLLLLVSTIPAGLTVVGVPAYLIATDAGTRPIAILALQGIVVVILAGRLALKVLRNRTPAPAVLADWIGDAAIVIAWAVVVVASISQHQGWMHGGLKWAIACILGLFLVAMPVYWWPGQGRVVSALTARASAGRWPWSA
jgi:hypothetical protein